MPSSGSSFMSEHVDNVIESAGGAQHVPDVRGRRLPRVTLVAGLRGLSPLGLCDEFAAGVAPDADEFVRAEAAETLLARLSGADDVGAWSEAQDALAREVLGAAYGRVGIDGLLMSESGRELGISGDEVAAGAAGTSVPDWLESTNACLGDVGREASRRRLAELAARRGTSVSAYGRSSARWLARVMGSSFGAGRESVVEGYVVDAGGDDEEDVLDASELSELVVEGARERLLELGEGVSGVRSEDGPEVGRAPEREAQLG